MLNQQTLAGNWNEVRGKLKQKWGKLTDDDLRSFNGNVDELVGRIQRKTGETRESVERFLSQMSDEGSSMLNEARERIEEGASQAADAARQGYETLRQGYAQAERVVQERPGQSLAVAFGMGLLSGLGLALMLRERSHHEAIYHRGRHAAENFANSVMDKLSEMMPSSFKGMNR
jgi:uncharacterized protein YjbJ (UPF0337 family)